ncbi:hypothetical protein B0H11DRAFT_2015490 [Mycena galericulata]|nr:hypothetical protein B0H11DRAFT_2015490 [Mycena galericulata]
MIWPSTPSSRPSCQTPCALHTRKSDHAAPPLRYVNNSGVCETTPGAYTMSGYVGISSTMSTWF